MAPTKVSIYSLKNGRFQVSYFDEVKGKRIRRKFTSIHEAKEFEHSLKSKFNQDQAEVAKGGRSFKVEDLVLFHLESCPNSKFRERDICYRSFMKHFADMAIFELDQHKMRDWFEMLRETRGYVEKTLSHIKAQINHFFKFLIDQSIIEVNPLIPYIRLFM